MIAYTIICLSLTQGTTKLPLLPPPATSGFYGKLSIDDLRSIDFVAIGRPIGAPIEQIFGDERWTLQKFVVTSPKSAATSVSLFFPTGRYAPKRSSLKVEGTKGEGRFAPPPPHNYLLLGQRSKNGTIANSLGGGESDSVHPTLQPGENVALGVALVETDLIAVPSSPTTEGAIFRGLALSTQKPRESIYGSLPLWNVIFPGSSASLHGEEMSEAPQRDVIEGQPSFEFLRSRIAMLFPSPSKRPTMFDAQVGALKALWEVDGSGSQLISILEGIVERGEEASPDPMGDLLSVLGSSLDEPLKYRIPSDRALRSAYTAKSSYVRYFALQFCFEKPSMSDQAKLVPLLADGGVRRRLLQKLSTWNKRPDLAPPSNEAAYAARESELVAAWKVWFNQSIAAKSGNSK